MAFHGTNTDCVKPILETGDLLIPGKEDANVKVSSKDYLHISPVVNLLLNGEHNFNIINFYLLWHV